MHHRLPQVFRARLAARVVRRGFSCGAVVHHDVRVIDRDVGHPLLEVANWVASERHDLAHQAVRFGDGAFRVVDETRLDDTPSALESRSVNRAQWMNLQGVYALCPRLQHSFGFSRIPLSVNRPFVFRTEPFTEPLTSASAYGDPYGGEYSNNNNRNYKPQGC